MRKPLCGYAMPVTRFPAGLPYRRLASVPSNAPNVSRSAFPGRHCSIAPKAPPNHPTWRTRMSCSRRAGVRRGSQLDRGKEQRGSWGRWTLCFFFLSLIVRGHVHVVVWYAARTRIRSSFLADVSHPGPQGPGTHGSCLFFALSGRLQTFGHPSVLQSCSRGSGSPVQRGALEMTAWVLLQHTWASQTALRPRLVQSPIP